jgi:hypothetical protein
VQTQNEATMRKKEESEVENNSVNLELRVNLTLF